MAPTVLLAEDDLPIRDALQDLLEEQGFDVVPADHGRQALEYLATNRPDLVILDLMMPLVTGWQVLETVRNQPELANVPVLVMTAAARHKPAGATELLRKPFGVDDFCDSVKRLSAGVR
jgi:CheY-like chemotaxis protein